MTAKLRVHFIPDPRLPMRSCTEIKGFVEGMVVKIRGVRLEHPLGPRETTSSVAEVTCPVCLTMLRTSPGAEIEAILRAVGRDRLLFLVKNKVAVPILPSRNLVDQGVEVFCCGGRHSVIRHQQALGIDDCVSAYASLAALLHQTHHPDRKLLEGAHAMMSVGKA